MADIKTPEERSRNMAAIRSNDTKPEITVRRYLHRCGYRYGLHNKNLPGKPDIVLRKYKTVIFIHGCFWHGHENCKYYRLPKSNVEFWQSKVEANRARDKRVEVELQAKGWRVLTIWECDLKTKERCEQTFNKLFLILNKIALQKYHPVVEIDMAAEPLVSYNTKA